VACAGVFRSCPGERCGRLAGDVPARGCRCRRCPTGQARGALAGLVVHPALAGAVDVGGLAMVGNLAFNWIGHHSQLQTSVSWILSSFTDFTGVPISPAIRQSIIAVNWLVPIFWFEPFVLRLNLPRGVAWLALRTGFLIVSEFFYWHSNSLISLFALVFSLPMLALIGWRSRPQNRLY